MSEMFILVMGETGAGKSSFINAVTGSNLQVGHGLESCTSVVNTSDPLTLRGQQFVLVDTPGFNDTTRTDADILMEIALFMGRSHKQKKQIAGVVYLHDITNIRMRGTAVRNIKMFREAVGDYAADNVVIVTTKWQLVATNIGNDRHSDLARGVDFFAPLIECGATMVKNTEMTPEEIFASVIAKPLNVPLQLPNEVVDQKKKVNKTAAGKILVLDIKRAISDTKERFKQQKANLKAQKGTLSSEEMKRLTAEIEKENKERIKALEDKNDAVSRGIDAKALAGSTS